MVLTERRSYRDVWVVLGILLGVFLVLQLPRMGPPAGAAGARDAKVLAVLGNARRTISDRSVRSADVTTVLGGCRLDLRELALAPGEEVVVDVLSVFGGVTIRVPDDWTVDAQAVPVLGSLRDLRLTELPEGNGGTARPRLVLHGAVVMGGIRITS
jgi:hypothetical protein